MRELFFRRRMRFMELLGLSVHGVSQNIRAIGLVILIIFLPIALLKNLVFNQYYIGLFELKEVLDVIDAGQASSEVRMQFFESIKNFALYQFLTVLIGIALEAVGIAAFVLIIHRWVMGEEIRVKEIITESFQLEGKLVVTGLLFYVLVWVGSLLVIPGLYIGINGTFYLTLLTLSGVWGPKALNESRRLVKGYWWSTLGYVLGLGLLHYGLCSVIDMLFLWGEIGLVQQVLYTTCTYLPQSLVTACTALLCFNRDALSGGTLLRQEITAEAVEL